MCVVYGGLQYVWFYANWAPSFFLSLSPSCSQALYLTGQNKLAGWMTGLLACWLVSWPSRMLLYHANGMNHAYWSLLPTDWLTQHSTQLNSTELNSSRIESRQVKSTVPVAKCRRRLHRRCCRRFKLYFFSLALLTINKKRKCKRRKPNSIELKTENN